MKARGNIARGDDPLTAMVRKTNATSNVEPFVAPSIHPGSSSTVSATPSAPPLQPPLRQPSSSSPRTVLIQPEENNRATVGLQKGFKSTFDVAFKLTKYAGAAASQIRHLAQHVSESKQSPFDHEIDRRLLEGRSVSVPPEWIRTFHSRCEAVVSPVVGGIPSTSAVSNRTALFEPWDLEIIDHLFYQAVMIIDLSCKGEGLNERVIQIGGRLLLSSHRLFFDPLRFKVDSPLAEWVISRSGYISLPHPSIRSCKVTTDWGGSLAYDRERSASVTTQRGYLQTCGEPRSIDSASNSSSKATACFIDLTLRDFTALSFYVECGSVNPNVDTHEGCVNGVSALLKYRMDEAGAPSVAVRGVEDPRPARLDLDYQGAIPYYAAFNPKAEYGRMKIDAKSPGYCTLSSVNKSYTLCPTYPPLLPVPQGISESELKEIVSFRSRGRLPVLSWRNPKTEGSLWRCSQPRSAWGGNRADEKFINEIICRGKSTFIFDARPFANAMANKFRGAGYEDMEAYHKCTLEFASIENIHKVAEAHETLLKALRRESRSVSITRHPTARRFEINSCPSSFWRAVYSGSWYDHLQTLLKASAQIANHLKSGETVLVHCSDGWDRTAQLTSLASLLVDPYYRTLVGFTCLIEKEYSWFGHKWRTRLDLPRPLQASDLPVPASSEGSIGMPMGDIETEPYESTTGSGEPMTENEAAMFEKSKGASPIFLQWLECVALVRSRYPYEFEFNESLLLGLATQLETANYGDFLFDNERQRETAYRSGYRWTSLFKRILNDQSGRFVNQEYQPREEFLCVESHPGVFVPWWAYWQRNGIPLS